MSTTESVTEEIEALLPICEANRQVVPNRLAYATNMVFRVGALQLIDRAP